MKPATDETRRYEDGAELRTNLSGWVCKHCSRYWGGDEHMARWCCANDLPCECGKRISPRGYSVCEDCRRRRESERHAARERVDWDGETPVYSELAGRYFFDPEALGDHLGDSHEVVTAEVVESYRLLLCDPEKPRYFDIAGWCHDYLPEDADPPGDWEAAEKAVNDWVAANAPFSWVPGDKALTTKSVLEWLDVPA